jgi:molecular chaperone DnaK (HSP70)
MTNIIIGIDLGTSNICLSYWNNDIKIIKVNDRNTFPSLIYNNNGEYLFGYDALPYLSSPNCYHSLKRLINSLDFNNLHKELYIQLLKYIKNICDNIISNYDIIITVPSFFNDNHRNITKECAELAGLNCIRIINESTSACIAYGFINNTDLEKIIMVFDIGAGTTDISFVKIDNDMIDVISSYGDIELGGLDITNKMIDFLLSKFINKYKITDIDNINGKDNRLYNEVEKIKTKLTYESFAEGIIEQFYDNINIDLSMTRSDMINNCIGIWNRIEKLVIDSLYKSNLTTDMIDYIILIGGTTKIPYIKNIIKKIFHNNNILDTIDPDTTVAVGAGILGSIINNTNKKELIVLDVSQYSYGIEGDNGTFITIIEKDMHLPCKIIKKFTTTDDDIENLVIKIYQGEHNKCKDNYYIGKIDLQIEKFKKGVPVINISFSLDINNILTIYVEDKKTGNNKQLIINN